MSLPFSESSSNRKKPEATEWDTIKQSRTGIYVVCLDCGRHFDYDWAKMRVVK
jgi:predicted transcriptional regulator